MEEKTKNWAIVVVGLLIIGVIASAGCIGEKPTEGGEAPPATQPSTTETSTATSGDGGTSLSDLLEKVKGTTSVKYDMATTSPGVPSVTSKVWVDEGKMRMETAAEGHNMIMIMDGLEAYMYDPEENMAIKMDFGNMPESAIDEIQSLMDYDPTVVGIETIDGKLCTVVEYTDSSEFMGESFEVKTKSWIWQKHGLPIRMESTSSEGDTTIMEMKNIDFGKIPDSMFELPAGAEVRDFQSMMESMLPTET
jgi:outer membrane lipoprotein-sorting protein